MKKVVRLWKLGSLEHGLTPNPETVKKLANFLKDKDGNLDIIWGPDIQLEIHEYNDEGHTKDIFALYKEVKDES